MKKIAVIGANGYTGHELLRLLACHPGVEVTIAVSKSNAGTPITDLYPNLTHYSGQSFCAVDLDRIAIECELAFVALPHGASAQLSGELVRRGVKVIDLSADFRYSDLSVYERVYGTAHPCADVAQQAVYGLVELYRERIKKTSLVANPGCYTTASILPLYPLLAKNLIARQGIIIDAKSGVTGAGRKADIAYNFCEVESDLRAYAVTTHRHTSEIEEKLDVTLTFTPHLLPIKRGILATIYCTPLGDADQIRAAFDAFYQSERFVHVLPEGQLPSIKHVATSNNAFIGFKMDGRTGGMVIVCCIDNLLKGASGQAIQNMNLLLGFNERIGLDTDALYL